MEIGITPQQSQNSGTSQFVVTVQSVPASASAASTSAATPNVASSTTTTTPTTSSNSTGTSSATANSDSSDETTMAGMVAPESEIEASAVLHGLSADATTTPTPAPLPTATQAYWAEQPAAVQALQNIPIGSARTAAAEALAQQGYTIDYPIMVEGWDPLMTMNLRAEDGYTWVPSMMQGNVQVAPGIDFPGLPSYDAANPPAGSIMVSTAFANGTSGDSLVNAINAADAADAVSST